MDTGENGDERQWRLTRQAIEAAGLTTGQVWLRYFGLAGDAGEYEVEAYLNGLIDLPSVQRDLLSHAVNELTDGLSSPPRAPYTRSEGQGHGEGPDRGRGCPDEN